VFLARHSQALYAVQRKIAEAEVDWAAGELVKVKAKAN
jgi:hypothetical protein